MIALEALEIGRAAEHLVVADLIMQGVRAFTTDQGLPYDVIAEKSGLLYRVQVKSTLRPKNVNSQGKTGRIAYMWGTRKRGKNGNKRLSAEHCEIVACVAMDIKKIAYLSIGECSQVVYMEAEGARPRPTTNNRIYFGKKIDDYTFERAITWKS